jgi:integral membrane protein (TIGR01906 family)
MRNSAILTWIVTLLTPLLLTGLALRLLLTPIFLRVEYNLPYFPADEYGFTRQERIYWATLASNYLINDRDISFLADLKFNDGSPLFNERELKHMEDVKKVTQGALKVWYVSLAGAILLGGWAWLNQRWPAYRLGLKRGGWVTVGLVGIIGLFAAVAFWQFFTFFHQLFFTGDSWLFDYSDTLIRLFPLRFWQDVFLWTGLLMIGGGVGLGWGLNECG